MNQTSQRPFNLLSLSIVAFQFAFIVGCQSMPRESGIAFSELQTRKTAIPDNRLEQRGIARVGEVIASFQPALQTVTEKYYEVLTISEIKGSAIHRSKPMEATAPSGDYKRVGANDKNIFYSAAVPIQLNGRPGFGGVVASRSEPAIVHGVFWRENKRYAENGGVLLFLASAAPVQGTLHSEVTTKTNPEWAGTRREMLYNGLSNGVLHFIYKEFTDDGLARPAFTTVVDLDYLAGKTYVYQKLEFTV